MLKKEKYEIKFPLNLHRVLNEKVLKLTEDGF